MRAAIHDRYGPPDVMQVVEVPTPEPASGEVRIRVVASSVTRSDTGLRGLVYPFTRVLTGIRRPKQLIAGTEFAGVVDAVAGDVTEWAVSDEVFGIRSGSNAEYVCVRAGGVIAAKPSALSFTEAAGIADGALLVLTSLKRAVPLEGKRVLVYGAAGSMGVAAVQLLVHHFGAHVTAVCDTRDVERVRDLGASEVIDRLQDDFTQNGETYDVIFDAVGKHSFRRCRRSLTPRGIYISADLGYLYHLPLLALVTRLGRGRRATVGIGTYRRDDLLLLKDLVEQGKYRPVVDRTYPLDDVAEAHRYVDAARKTGNVVLTIAATPPTTV